MAPDDKPTRESGDQREPDEELTEEALEDVAGGTSVRRTFVPFARGSRTLNTDGEDLVS